METDTYRVATTREVCVVVEESADQAEAKVQMLESQGWERVGGDVVCYPHGGWWDNHADKRVSYVQCLERDVSRSNRR